MKKNVIDTPCESNINTVVREHFSSENTQTFWYCCQSTMINYRQPIFKSLNRVKLLKKLVLPEVSKLSDSVMIDSHRDQTVFSRIRKMIVINKIRKIQKKLMGLILFVYSPSAIR